MFAAFVQSICTGLLEFPLSIMAAVLPGKGSDAEKQAASNLLAADLVGLLDTKEVQRDIQVDLALSRIKTISRLAVIADTRAELRDFCKDTLQLDPAATAAHRVDLA